MRFTIRAMTEPDAMAVAGWHYPGEYAFYDFEADPSDLGDLLDPAGWGDPYFAADGDDGSLAGFFQLVRADRVLDIGLGLRPDLVGRGAGAASSTVGSASPPNGSNPSRSPSRWRPSTSERSPCMSGLGSGRSSASTT